MRPFASLKLKEDSFPLTPVKYWIQPPGAKKYNIIIISVICKRFDKTNLIKWHILLMIEYENIRHKKEAFKSYRKFL